MPEPKQLYAAFMRGPRADYDASAIQSNKDVESIIAIYTAPPQSFINNR
jgi:hypothetical protein